MSLEKYIEEKFQRWFVFGSSVPGMVDVCDSTHTIVTVPMITAESIIKERDNLIDKLVKALLELNKSDPIKFKEIYYNNSELKD